jgi:gliding motility-associated-like protein
MKDMRSIYTIFFLTVFASYAQADVHDYLNISTGKQPMPIISVVDWLYTGTIKKEEPAATNKVLACTDDGGDLVTTIGGTAINNNVINFANFGSTISFTHSSGDASNDGNPATAPGFDLGIYVGSPPTATGPTAAAINADIAYSGSVVGTSITGNATFTNMGGYQTAFNGGNPVHLWFAPLTLDDHAGQVLTENAGMPSECINVATAEQINIVFLNQIETFAFSNPAVAGGNLCVARIRLRGGLPEWDASNYNISVHLSGNPAVTATISPATLNVTHNSLLEFTVPQPGNYDIVITDNNGATRTFTVPMLGCVVCNDNAGTASTALGAGAQSNNTTYLCYGDVLQVTHNGNAILTGDPNTATPSGLGYVMYRSQPTTTPTNTVASIASNPNIVNQSGSSAGFDLVSGTDINGNVTITNNGLTYQNILGGIGVAGQLWFAPITVDNHAANAFESTGTPNECTNVNIGAAFPVVFLNEIQASNLSTSICNGSFDIIGGLPQYDNTNYNISITLVSDPTITGTVTNAPPVDHGGKVTFTVPRPGLYEVLITDALGCSATSFQTLMNACPFPCNGVVNASLNITSNYNGAAISCDGASNGSLSLSVVGGVAPFTIVWSHDAMNNTNTASGLAAGTYGVTVTDANGCLDTPTIVLADPGPIIINLDSTPVLCNGDMTSTIFVAALSGGTAPYTYAWSSGTVGVTPNRIVNVGAGSYTVTVTDANNCTGTSTLILTEPTVLTSSITDVDNTDCNASANGTATVVPAGGTTTFNDYTFLWSNNQTDSVATGLVAGLYNVTVTDDNGCTSLNSVTIIEEKSISIDLDSVDVLCNGNATGQIVATVNTIGGAANLPYIYAWSHNNGILTNTATNLVAGTYHLTVTDALGCSSSETTIVNEPSALGVTTQSQTNIICAGDATGAATINVTGGVLPYTYSWSNNISNSATIANVVAGTHSVTITDANNCTITHSVTITQNPPIVANVVTNILNCAGDTNGGFTVTASGGVGSLSYSWSTNPVNDTLNAITGLSTGIYSVTITDGLGCDLVQTYTLSDPLPLSGTISQVNLACANFQNGQASITMSGGTAPYFFAWSGGTQNAAGNTITGLVAGLYSVTVTDALGCTYTDDVTITAPPAIDINITFTQVSCVGGNDGTATATVTGGAGGFIYSWDNGQQTGQTAAQLNVGQHFLLVTDQTGCLARDTVIVTSVSPLVPINIESNPVSCFGGNDGSATVDVSGGTPPYTYSWNTTPVQDSSTAVGLTQGVYELFVIDANGCALTPIIITVNEPTPLTIDTIIGIDPLCYNGNDGSVLVVPVGGTPSYSYQWTGSNAITNAANNLTAGTYRVTVTDANGCTTTSSTFLNDPLILIGQVSTNPTSCNGGKDGRIQIDTVLGGFGPYTYSIDGISFLPSDIIFFGLFGGNYDVTIRDANGCTFVESVLIEEPPLIVVDLGPDIEIDLGQSVELEAFVNTTDSLIYEWESLDSTLTCYDCPNPTVRPTSTAEYFVTVVDTSGCQATDLIVVVVDKNRRVFIPTGFSPNADGRNDRFIVYGGTGVEEILTFKVFDRWGQLVHVANNFLPGSYADGWDGRVGSSSFVNPGVYVYYVEVRFSDGEIFPYKGDVTIIR